MSGKDVIEYYRTRFQIEFCFRNAKQFTGLNHSQSRKIERLRFNFNASLTAVNIGKVLAKERDIPFSKASLKRKIHYEYLLLRFSWLQFVANSLPSFLRRDFKTLQYLRGLGLSVNIPTTSTIEKHHFPCSSSQRVRITFKLLFIIKKTRLLMKGCRAFIIAKMFQ